MTDPAQEALGRQTHFTPLRYPGGKAKLAGYIKHVLRENQLLDGEYVEPYAGGAGIAIELLLQEYVSRVHINDISKPLYAFWRSVLRHSDELCRMIVGTRLTVASWDRQRQIYNRPADHSAVEYGFATFFLNRTNRSGILNGGIIGGRDQTGPWKIDARYNGTELARRVEEIAKMAHRIRLTRQDALEFLRKGVQLWPSKTLIYLDPPYYVKGHRLYHNFYCHSDHEQVANLILNEAKIQPWIISYDDVPQIRKLYKKTRHITYDIGYSARSARTGSEVMFFRKDLQIPPLVGPVRRVG